MFPEKTFTQTRWYASEDVARWLGVRHADLYNSFLRMAEVWPEVFDCGVEFSSSKRISGGGRFASLLMTGAALAAFLYWRDHHGKPEGFFNRMSLRKIDGSEGAEA